MRKLSDRKRNLLRHCAEQERVISGFQRTTTHQPLLRIGYIEERAVNLQAPNLTAAHTKRSPQYKGTSYHWVSRLWPLPPFRFL